MKEIILNILKANKEFVSLAEGHYDYMIYGDDENLEELAEIIKNSIKDLVD